MCGKSVSKIHKVRRLPIPALQLLDDLPISPLRGTRWSGPSPERRDTAIARAIPMAELTCPLCGSTVRVPSAEINTRYSCKKCHSPFHLNKSRVAVVGKPPDVEVEL